MTPMPATRIPAALTIGLIALIIGACGSEDSATTSDPARTQPGPSAGASGSQRADSKPKADRAAEATAPQRPPKEPDEGRPAAGADDRGQDTATGVLGLGGRNVKVVPVGPGSPQCTVTLGAQTTTAPCDAVKDLVGGFRK